MRIAIPVWQDNISTVLDFANKLLIVELENGVETSRNKIVLPEQSCTERAATLRQIGINVIICGAISRPLAYSLGGSGIDVLPFVTGLTEEILKAYKNGNLNLSEYALPGCWKDARRGFVRRRCRHGRRQ